MKNIKRFFLVVFVGALVGSVFTAWFSPGTIEWYFSPPADLALTCKPAVSWAIETYRKVILIGGVAGMVLAALLYLAFGMRSKPVPLAPLPGTEVK
jgi:hypothetical protein